MTGFLLDTNVLSEFSRIRQADQNVDRWLKGTPDDSLFASVLTFAEIRRGIELLPAGNRRNQLEEWQDDLLASENPEDTGGRPSTSRGSFLRVGCGGILLCGKKTRGPTTTS